MLTTLNPNTLQALQAAGQQGAASTAQRVAMLQQQAAGRQQQQAQQRSGTNGLAMSLLGGGAPKAPSMLPEASQFWNGASAPVGNLGFGAGGGTQLGISAAPSVGLTAPTSGFWAGAGGAAGGLGGLGGTLAAAPGVATGAATSGIGAGGTLGAFAEGGGAAAAAPVAPWLLGGLALASLGNKDHNITNLFGLFK